MHPRARRLQLVLYPVFLVCCTAAVLLSLLQIWGLPMSTTSGRLLGTCVVLAIGSALTMSATALVVGPAPEAGDGS